MPASPEPPIDPGQQGISLDELAEAFAQAMGTVPRKPPAPAIGEPAQGEGDQPDATPAGSPATQAPKSDLRADIDQHCPLGPRSILEAMLFVGNREGAPLAPAEAAAAMRGVEPGEIAGLVDELNARYQATGCPYFISNEGSGYRLTLRTEFGDLRERYYGRLREARLSQAAIDVLAIVAYQQPVTADQIARLRGKPNSHVLSQLVRRGLLRIDRESGPRKAARYSTTSRFLKLFGLAGLDDLPRD